MLSAQECSFNQENSTLLSHSIYKHYCASSKEESELCQTYRINYIDTDENSRASFFRGINQYVEPFLKTYRERNPQKEVVDMLQVSEGEVSGEWYDTTNIELCTKTPATYTIRFSFNGYSGGSHGYDRVKYANIDIQTQKELTLKELFLPQSQDKLFNIAQDYYKKTFNLKPSDPLTYDSWFEDKFIFAENFIIQPQGISFLYNQYEIKPYSEGQTEFFLPYSIIRDLINPKGAIAFARNASFETMKYIFKNKNMQLFVTTKRQGDILYVAAHLYSEKSAENTWFSASFPQIGSKREILSTGYTKFDHLIPYDRKNMIYNDILKKSVPAKYMLIEADKHNLKPHEKYTMWFRLKIPKHLKTFIIDIRATLKNGKMTYEFPKSYDGVRGQQGFKNYRIILPL